MDVLPFSTDNLPPERRLSTFQQGAVDYRVDAVGDPLAFESRWRLLVVGELNLIESWISPVSYRRTRADIAADGKDRISVLCVLDGRSEGTIDDMPVSVGPGDAMVFDLLRPLDLRSDTPLHTLIVNLPRFLLDEDVSRVSNRIPAGPELDLVVGQIRHLLDHAGTIPPESAVHHAWAMRDLLSRAFLAADRTERDAGRPLLEKIARTIDNALSAPPGEHELADSVGASRQEVSTALQSVGGWAQLVEHRRLLAAYRLLCSPRETAPVGTIAQRCGMQNLADFSRRFRLAFGASPREVRARQHGDLPRWAGGYRVASHYRDLMSPADED
jgi:AraC-like DNA-binding protein